VLELYPLESAAFSRRTPKADLFPCQTSPTTAQLCEAPLTFARLLLSEERILPSRNSASPDLVSESTEFSLLGFDFAAYPSRQHEREYQRHQE